MGMGEPLYNYENVATAMKIAMDGEGLSISKRKITLSTSGVVPEMERCGSELDVNLAVSLHATTDETRDWIMPINKKYPSAVYPVFEVVDLEPQDPITAGEPASAVSAAGDSAEPARDGAGGAADAYHPVDGVFDDELDARIAGESSQGGISDGGGFGNGDPITKFGLSCAFDSEESGDVGADQEGGAVVVGVGSEGFGAHLDQRVGEADSVFGDSAVVRVEIDLARFAG
jgi:hypothetical protein